MSKNRDRLSIIAAILEAANSGSSKTRIMFRANLSFKILEKYLSATVSAGFLRIDDCRYILTDSGREFLRLYRENNESYVKAQKFLERLTSERKKLSTLCENTRWVDHAGSFMEQK